MTDLTTKQDEFAKQTALGKMPKDAYAIVSPKATEGSCKTQGHIYSKDPRIIARAEQYRKQLLDEVESQEEIVLEAMGSTEAEIIEQMDKLYGEAKKAGRLGDVLKLLEKRLAILKGQNSDETTTDKQLIARLQQGRKFMSESYDHHQQRVAGYRTSQ